MEPPEVKATRRIRLLPEEIYNRIAAGEVVERPASVLKELMENALDAGATHLQANVSGAGRKEIQVSDDGEGMSKEDLLLAFERHATSKVSRLEDLEAIHTLGFRGEALSAIASVSRIEASSRLRGNLLGYRLRLVGGKIQELEETGTPEGSTIVIRDLFFNTPARKKFLKSTNVENSHLINVFKRFALAYPDLRWSMDLEGRNLYRLPPEAAENRILAIFSDDLKGRLFPVEFLSENARLSGFIGAPSLARRSRGDQHFYINRRWIQNRLLSHAVTSAYQKLLEPGAFPFYVLFLEIPGEDVDVNVHPAKIEVKLRRESEIYSFLLDSIEQTLQRSGLASMPFISLKSGETVDQGTGEIVPPRAATGASPYFSPQPPPSFPPRQQIASAEAYQLAFGANRGVEKVVESKMEEPALAKTAPGDRTQVYQMHQRFIVTEIRGGLAIIDQHAAHERVLYEKALKAWTGAQIPSQQLLFPQLINLDAEHAERLREVLEDLLPLGISIREFGERSFLLESLPMGIQLDPEGGVILEILDELKERGLLRSPGREPLAAAFACRAAIKFGQSLTLGDMNELIDQLFATRFPFTCPHGRPTLLQLTLGELERRFGRS